MTLKILGRGQFGYPAVDFVSLKSIGGSGVRYSRQGTRKCFSAFYDIIIIKISGIDPNGGPPDGPDLDLFQIGIGRSIGDDASPPPRPDKSFRFPLPYRIRDASSIRGCHDVLGGKFYTVGNGMIVDVQSQTVEVIVDPDAKIHTGVILIELKFF